MFEAKIRLENEKRMYVVDLKGDTFRIISGSLKGTVSSEEHRMLAGDKGRTPEQEAVVRVGKLVETKLKGKYVVKKGDVEALRAEVQKLTAKPVSKKYVNAYIKMWVKMNTVAGKIDELNKQLSFMKTDATEKAKKLTELGVNVKDLEGACVDAIRNSSAKKAEAKAKAKAKAKAAKKA